MKIITYPVSYIQTAFIFLVIIGGCMFGIAEHNKAKRAMADCMEQYSEATCARYLQ